MSWNKRSKKQSSEGRYVVKCPATFFCNIKYEKGFTLGAPVAVAYAPPLGAELCLIVDLLKVDWNRETTHP